jgi:hypothetical protein
MAGQKGITAMGLIRLLIDKVGDSGVVVKKGRIGLKTELRTGCDSRRAGVY